MTDINSTSTNEVPEEVEAETEVEVSVTDAMSDYEGRLREKILFGLRVYPFVSPTMLHNFLGTSTSARLWKSILQELVGEGLITRTEVQLTSPHDRVQTYSVLHLTTNLYPQAPLPLITETTEAEQEPNSGN